MCNFTPGALADAAADAVQALSEVITIRRGDYSFQSSVDRLILRFDYTCEDDCPACEAGEACTVNRAALERALWRWLEERVDALISDAADLAVTSCQFGNGSFDVTADDVRRAKAVSR